ncbi:hypothetical protein [Actinacidiphila oryziradicis]|jgi:hypothetical protein|uniref:hypothetical protein n=1 Tax=Actinacidiphila oryziradicis TaxID=2571141 RepID=UPI0023F4E494|nr:hypothetical protein [Actinacidiphila oryziradicis]MCW2872567.1 hypothetical protein [Actinacidiphila oryziradicis]
MKDRFGSQTMLRRGDRQQDESTFLAIYLNDHLAGSTAGVELCRHLAEAERGGSLGIGETLERLAEEIDQDRSTLLDIMSALSVPVRYYKVGAGWVGEKVARLKPHGSMLRRTRLDTLIELEALWLGVEGKVSLWRTLVVLADTHQGLAEKLAGLLDRAYRQATALEEMRVRAAAAAFVMAPSSPL